MRRHDIEYFIKDQSGKLYDPDQVLADFGAMLDVTIAMPKLLSDTLVKAGATPPSPVTVRALIDTGCTRTAIDGAIINQLGLPITGTTKTHTAAGVVDATLHPVYLHFPQLTTGQFLPQAMACDLAGGFAQVLLGTDLLRHCVMIYDGIAGRVTLMN